MSTMTYVVGGAVSLVVGTLVLVIITKFIPWAIEQRLEDIIKAAVKEAFVEFEEQKVKPLRAKVADLEKRVDQYSNGSRKP